MTSVSVDSNSNFPDSRRKPSISRRSIHTEDHIASVERPKACLESELGEMSITLAFGLLDLLTEPSH